MRRIEIGCPETSPQGGDRKTYLEIPSVQPPEVEVASVEALALELQVKEKISGVEGFRLVREEPDGTVVQEFDIPVDMAYELFLKLKEIDEDAFS